MNKTTIDWRNPAEGWKLDYTWNPLYGCAGNCGYCYAEKLHNERHELYKKGKLQKFPQYALPFNQLQVFEERMIEPYHKKKPCTIFVGSMCDIYYHTLNDVKSVIKVCSDNRQHRFMLSTKMPIVYNQLLWPENCWLGCTIESALNIGKARLRMMKRQKNNKTFISIEPIFSHFHNINFTGINLVIVGADTSPKPVIPKNEWIESIVHPNIHYKKNILRYMK